MTMTMTSISIGGSRASGQNDQVYVVPSLICAYTNFRESIPFGEKSGDNVTE
jgi:hypothetical protein